MIIAHLRLLRSPYHVTEEAKPFLKQQKMNPEQQVQKKWYAIYTKPRWEKKVHDLMVKRGFESYCPLNKVRKKWSDRYKIVEEPLFKSYVFVHVPPEEMSSVRFVDGVVNFVYWLGKPAIVNADDIERIKRFLNDYSNVTVEKIEEIRPGTKVKVTSGVFMDLSGKVVEDRNKTVILEIESLAFRLVAQVSKDQIISVPSNTK